MAEAGARRRGLEPEEFEAGVTRKITNLFDDHFRYHEVKIGKILKDIKKVVVKRDKKTDDGTTVDKRRSSSSHYSLAGMLPADHDILKSPKQAQADTTGHQGVTRVKKLIHQTYHAEQYELFIKLKEITENCSVGPDGSLYEGNNKIDSDAFGEKIDCVCKSLFEDFKNAEPPQGIPTDDQISLAGKLASQAERCRNILMGRFQGDMIVENDLNNPGQRELWQQHVNIMFSFAALWVVLILYREKVTGNADVNPTGPCKV